MKTRLTMLLLLGAVGCSETHTLLVDLRTDYVPGIEVVGVESVVRRGDFDGPVVGRDDTTVFYETTLVDGVRVAEVSGLTPGLYVIRTTLRRNDGTALATQRTRVRVDSTVGATVLITRDCAGVMCPAAGDAAATACIGMRCVDPQCSPETPELCPEDDACSPSNPCPEAPAACAESACIAGVCFLRARPDACASDEACQPEVGCEALPDPAVDAGPPDSATPDGAPDSGLPDSGTTCLTPGPFDDTPRSYTSMAPPPELGSYLDPVFGTKITRVTGPSRGARGTFPFPPGSMFNADDTRIVVQNGSGLLLYQLEPTTGTVTFGRSLDVDCAGAVWSRTNPDELFCVGSSDALLRSVDVSGATSAMVAITDLDDMIPGGGSHLSRLHTSWDQTVFGISAYDSSSEVIGAVVYDRTLDTSYYRAYPRGSELWVAIDGGGDSALLTAPDGWDVWDFHGDSVAHIRSGVTARPTTSFEPGRDEIIMLDHWDWRVVRRSFDSLTTWDPVLEIDTVDGLENSDLQPAFSMNQDDQRWAAVSFWSKESRILDTTDPFEQEIVVLALDGTFALRLAHHRSEPWPFGTSEGYQARPYPSISYTGRWLGFTSNFGTGRADVYILPVPEICP